MHRIPERRFIGPFSGVNLLMQLCPETLLFAGKSCIIPNCTIVSIRYGIDLSDMDRTLNRNLAGNEKGFLAKKLFMESQEERTKCESMRMILADLAGAVRSTT